MAVETGAMQPDENEQDENRNRADEIGEGM